MMAILLIAALVATIARRCTPTPLGLTLRRGSAPVVSAMLTLAILGTTTALRTSTSPIPPLAKQAAKPKLLLVAAPLVNRKFKSTHNAATGTTFRRN